MDDDDPESRAKILKKKAIMVTGGAVLLFAITAAASNAFFGTKERADKPLSNRGIATVATPAEQLPDKYSDIGKYQKNKGNDLNSNGSQAGQATTSPNTVQNSYRPSSTTTSRPAAVTYVPTAPATVSNSSYRDTAAAEEEKAVKAQQAINSSALAFKIAAAVSQGQTPEFTPVSTGAAGVIEIQNSSRSYAFSDDEPQDMGSYVLNAGAVIQATLLTGVTSDVPNGDVVAQVRQNIYDSLTGTHLLIPQGSRMIGTTGATGGLGNQRISVVFKRIILPNGASLTLPNQQAIDGTGYPGLMDKYNEHRGKLYQTAFLSALFSAAAQSLTGNTSGSDKRSPGQEAVSGAVASILQTGQKLIEKDANINPTIEIEPGFQFSIFVNQDLAIGAYHD
ncbi:TrbI/VirB10 family protein [Pectinatus frisingensis]|uniref:TrbI/VirB10 family protein n=2 Tax=Pectinatus frisingensis TaxID=865 RepID=UPI0018C4E010|nr:TrbI/VirB10 family protein [Pectinatus frisingensis]